MGECENGLMRFFCLCDLRPIFSKSFYHQHRICVDGNTVKVHFVYSSQRVAYENRISRKILVPEKLRSLVCITGRD